jgi:hypothetical protein
MQDKAFFVLLLASGTLFLTTGNHTNRLKVSLATILLLTGILIGLYGFREQSNSADPRTKQDAVKLDPIPLLIQEISASNIDSYLR